MHVFSPSAEICKHNSCISAEVIVSFVSNPSYYFDLTSSGGNDQKFKGSCKCDTNLQHSKNSNSALRLCDDHNVINFNERMMKSFEG